MNYFAPRLYAKLNSSDSKKSLAAHREWERAEARYEARLREIRPRLPKSVRFLADKLCLHDGLFLGCLPISAERTSINVRTDDSLYELNYHLKRPVVSTQFAFGGVFVNQQPRWLYDEVEMMKAGIFSHEILLSNGLVLKCVFDDVDFRASEVHLVGASANGSKRTAAGTHR